METRTYVKMCDCPEIQSKWTKPPQADDCCYRKEDGKISWGSHLTSATVDEWIWLPRQDDIQKLFKEEDFVLAGKFSDDMENYITGDPSWWTMKGLWLAYYMWKKHGKIWGGTKWVEEDE